MTSLSCGSEASDTMFLPSSPGLSNIWYQSPVDGGAIRLPSFMCSGCKELGIGSSYNCENSNCNYILHKECVKPVKHALHPFFKNCNFEFYENAEKDSGFCDACGKDLLDTISNDDGKVIMTLCHEVPSDCVKCNQRHVVRNNFEGWSYVFDSDSSDEKSCIHVSCFKDMILESLNDNKETTSTTRSNGKIRSFMKFTGKLAVNILKDIVVGDISSIHTVVEAIASSFSE
ncbi:hypothetical protein A2U01_0000893 [Trifolium medium]|uniref:Uncharacterized protein n=1 Tax=Trifolium medium TaxID=97028 RepID=A0A392LYR9_9FABA|nr:hypothetical protein [Trifolium medium]